MDFFIKHSAPFMKLCRSVILYAESVIFQGPQMRLEIDAISGDIQKYTEYLVVKYIKSILEKTKQKNFVGSGGLYMNIKLNKAISEIKGLKDIFISASAGDESLSIGCCYYLNRNEKSYSLKKLSMSFI